MLNGVSLLIGRIGKPPRNDATGRRYRHPHSIESLPFLKEREKSVQRDVGRLERESTKNTGKCAVLGKVQPALAQKGQAYSEHEAAGPPEKTGPRGDTAPWPESPGALAIAKVESQRLQPTLVRQFTGTLEETGEGVAIRQRPPLAGERTGLGKGTEWLPPLLTQRSR